MTQLPPNSTVRYRILTEKSTPGFGKYADLPLSEILKVDPDYIPWLYFCKEKISLCQELRERFALPDIPKPGQDTEGYFDWLREKRRAEGLTPEHLQNIKWKKYHGRKRMAISRLAQANKDTCLSKAQLQAINHGHYKG